MLEREVEDRLIELVEDGWGGIAWKFIVRNVRGIPDRVCFLPGGVLLLVELKRPKRGKLSTVQCRIHHALGKLGFVVHVCNTLEAVEDLITHTMGGLGRCR